MRVRYVKPGVSGRIGDIKTHDAAQARVLIKLGIVEPYHTQEEPAPKPKPKRAAKKVARKRTPKRGEAFGNLPIVSKRDDEVPTKKETSD